MKKILVLISVFLISLTVSSQSKTGCISGDCANGKGVFIFVRGGGSSFNITFSDDNSGISQNSGNDRWEKTFYLKKGSIASLSAQLSKGDNITIEIYLNDNLVKNTSSNGAFSIASNNYTLNQDGKIKYIVYSTSQDSEKELDKYEGDFEKSHLKGYGKYTDFRGNVYVGYFKDDKFNGVGMFTRTDGTKYIGEFLNGKRNGLGTQWYSETYKEKGKWENDRYIEAAEFEDFVISESYDFCTEFLKVFNASANNYSDVKGMQVSEYITDSYYCNVKIKELSTVEIKDKEGFTGVYFKGEKEEGLKKFEELNKIISSCIGKSCCVFQNKFLNGVAEKKYEYTPVSVSANCNSNLLKEKIVIICKIQKNLTEVILSIINY